jgi:hypothetical protein
MFSRNLQEELEYAKDEEASKERSSNSLTHGRWWWYLLSFCIHTCMPIVVKKWCCQSWSNNDSHAEANTHCESKLDHAGSFTHSHGHLIKTFLFQLPLYLSISLEYLILPRDLLIKMCSRKERKRKTDGSARRDTKRSSLNHSPRTQDKIKGVWMGVCRL